jgi:hypothetical protein
VSRPSLLIVATACLLGGLAAVTGAPHPKANAQSGNAPSGQARAFGENACLDYGVAPNSAAYESCVNRAAQAFERGEPDIAYMQARITRDAREACLSLGLAPDTLGYKQCVANQVERRTHGTMLIR